MIVKKNFNKGTKKLFLFIKILRAPLSRSFAKLDAQEAGLSDREGGGHDQILIFVCDIFH